MTRFVLALSLAACTAAVPLRAADAPDNTLTAREKADGWQLLFDGKTTAGWHGYNQSSFPDGWAVRDGALTRVGGPTVDIVTDKEYANFDLQFDWKIAPKGNSGLFFHVVESPTLKSTYFSGPEYQLIDNEGHPDGKNGPDRWAGANYALHAPTRNTANPVGQWNHSRLVVDNGHVEHWLNGVKVLEFNRNSDDFRAHVAAGKFRNTPGFGTAGRGRILLQDHGDAVAYRSIKIRAL